MAIAALLLFVAAAAVSHGPFTTDFIKFIEKNPSGTNTPSHHSRATGTFGGRSTANEEISHDPVLFIHGSSESALN
ncbi:hypothetical protein PENTCL1PPCAC_26369, partial [Pristionchus entomophagus]